MRAGPAGVLMAALLVQRCYYPEDERVIVPELSGGAALAILAIEQGSALEVTAYDRASLGARHRKTRSDDGSSPIAVTLLEYQHSSAFYGIPPGPIAGVKPTDRARPIPPFDGARRITIQGGARTPWSETSSLAGALARFRFAETRCAAPQVEAVVLPGLGHGVVNFLVKIAPDEVLIGQASTTDEPPAYYRWTLGAGSPAPVPPPIDLGFSPYAAVASPSGRIFITGTRAGSAELYVSTATGGFARLPSPWRAPVGTAWIDVGGSGEDEGWLYVLTSRAALYRFDGRAWTTLQTEQANSDKRSGQIAWTKPREVFFVPPFALGQDNPTTIVRATGDVLTIESLGTGNTPTALAEVEPFGPVVGTEQGALLARGPGGAWGLLARAPTASTLANILTITPIDDGFTYTTREAALWRYYGGSGFCEDAESVGPFTAVRTLAIGKTLLVAGHPLPAQTPATIGVVHLP
jgi:hypothetical protein